MRKKGMKYIISIVILVLVIMTLVACADFGKEPASVEGGLHVEESVDSIDSEDYISGNQEE